MSTAAIVVESNRRAARGKRTRLTTSIKCVSPVLALVFLALATGCAVGPNYVPPQVKTPPEWNTQLSDGLSALSPNPQTLAQWWASLNDPVLTDLIGRAVAGNLDLQQAVARVREARARRGIAISALFPSVNSSGARTYIHTSDRSSDSSSLNLDAAWELDIFGGVRRSVEAATAELQASQENLNTVLVTLLAEVALNYIDFRTLQERLSVAESNLKLQEETYSLVTARYEAGLTSHLDIDQARTNLENTRAQIPALRESIEQTKNQIAVLLGQDPGAVDAELAGQEPLPAVPVEMAVGVPAEVLRQRPDIRSAERQLAAQTARIGVATAELYPKFQLSGSIGLDALSLSDLFLPESRTFRGGPSFSWPLFTAGRIRQNIEVQNALAEQTLIQYNSVILAALQDVENALVAFSQDQIRNQSLQESAKAALSAADLAQTQYAAGLVDFQVVLDAQRSLLVTQETLAVNEGQIVTDVVQLYKALGGGWTTVPPAEEMGE